MLEPGDLCHNKGQVALKEEIEFYHDKEIFYCDTVEEVCEEDCRDTLDYVTTLIKAKGIGNFSRQSLLC